jgi:hypothetical protein
MNCFLTLELNKPAFIENDMENDKWWIQVLSATAPA